MSDFDNFRGAGAAFLTSITVIEDVLILVSIMQISDSSMHGLLTWLRTWERFKNKSPCIYAEYHLKYVPRALPGQSLNEPSWGDKVKASLLFISASFFCMISRVYSTTTCIRPQYRKLLRIFCSDTLILYYYYWDKGSFLNTLLNGNRLKRALTCFSPSRHKLVLKQMNKFFLSLCIRIKNKTELNTKSAVTFSPSPSKFLFVPCSAPARYFSYLLY